jgi:hypothetical protein
VSYRRVLILVIGASVSACSRESTPYIGLPDSSARGTYEVVFCRRLCRIEDSATAIIRGVLVLDSSRISVPDSLRDYFEHANAGEWATTLRHDNPGAACFALREPGRPQVTRAGYAVVRDWLPAVALTNWRYRRDSTGLAFDLLRSPDASFGVRGAQLSGGRLVGIARTAGELYRADFGVRYMVGRRIGDPQPSLCLAAAPAHWTFDSLRSVLDSLRS